MNVKQKVLLFLASIVIVAVACLCFSGKSNAEALSVQKGYGTDEYVFAPAVYDLVVVTNLTDPSFQWFVGVGRNVDVDDLIELDVEGTDGWAGSNTQHLSLKTHDGIAYTPDESGWDGLYFTCRVTGSDGRVFWGPDMNMVIHTHEELLERMKKDGVGITASSVRYWDSSALRYAGEVDGVKYYDTHIDKAFVPSVTFHPMDRDLRSHSDGELRTETYMTVDGKTTQFTAFEQGYRPERYGTTVVFRTDLVLYVNGERMETIDSVTSVVNVKAPEGVGTALTNANCSLLAEQYSQSRVLKNLGKKELVTLLSEAGGYWRVAVGGYIGYIPKTALAVSDSILSLSLEIREPTSYQTVPSTATMGDPNKYEMKEQFNQEMWYDKTAGKFLSSNDVFQPGHTYEVVIWLSAKSGYRYPLSGGKPDVSAYVNGIPATVRKAYEQDPEEVIEITYTFEHTHDLTKVNRVYPTCTTAGKEYHYRCGGCGWTFEDEGAAIRITEEDWGILPARGHWESAWMSNGTEHYKFCQRRECMETITGTKGAHTGGKATCYSEAVCSVCGLLYGGKAPHTYSSDWTYRTEEGHAHSCTEIFCDAHDAVRPHTPGPAATATAPQVCLDCGFEIAPPDPNAPVETKSEETHTEETSVAPVETVPESTKQPETKPVEEQTESIEESGGSTPVDSSPTAPDGSEYKNKDEVYEFPTWIIILIAGIVSTVVAGAVVAIVLITKLKKKER